MSTMTVGELLIGLRADVARVKSDMDETKRAVGGAMKDVEGYVNSAKSVITSLIGVASIGAFAGFVQSSIKARAGLVDLAAQSGITVEALSAMGKVAKYSDTALTDIVGASTKLSKALFTTNEESKGAAQGLKALGLDYAEFKRLAPEQQLLTVAKAMEQFQDGTGKSATAMLLFGKTGATLLPFLRDLAEKNSLVGKVTTENALAAKAYEKNLKDLESIGDSWKNKLVNEMVPALSETSKAFLENARTSGVFLGVLKTLWQGGTMRLGFDEFREGKQLAEAQSNALALLTKEYQKYKGYADNGDANAAKRVEQIRVQLDAMTRSAQASNQQLKDLANVYDNYSNEGRNHPKAKLPDTAPKADKPWKDKGKEYDQQFQDYLEMLKEEAKWQKEATNENARYVEQQQAHRDSLEQQVKDMKKARDEYGLSAEAIEQLEIARMRDAAAALEQKAAVADNAYLAETANLYRQQAAALRDLAATRTDLATLKATDRNDPITGARNAVKGYLSDIERAGDATRSVVEDSMKGLESVGTKLLTRRGGKAAAAQWVDGILGELIRLQIVRPMLQSIFGAILPAIGRLFGGGATGASSNGSWDVGGSLGGSNGSWDVSGLRAAGGPVLAGKNYVVGEKGPEILRMGAQGGTVIPNGGQAMTFTYAPQIHIDARADQAAIAAQTAQAVQQGNKQMLSLLKARGVI